MKTLLPALLLLAACPAWAAEPSPWLERPIPQFVLADGKTYTDVTITRIETDTVTITHAAGIGRIPMAALKPEARQALGYDPEKAAAAQAAAKKAALAAATARMQAAAARAESARLAERTKTRTFIVRQVLDEGYLVNTHDRGGAVGSAARAMRLLGGSTRSYVRPTSGTILYLLRCDIGTDIADGDIIDARHIETDETHRYFDTLGAKRTIKILDLIDILD